MLYLKKITKNVSNNYVDTNYISSPLDQFEIRDLISLDSFILNLHLSLSNIGLYLTSGTILALTISLIANNSEKIVPNS
jgi:F-type H+-transporting ATPase subunit a